MRFRDFILGLIAGFLACYAGVMLENRASVRSDDFGMLARDVRVASQVAELTPAARAKLGEVVASDLHIIFMRYSSVRSDEAMLLKLVERRVAEGTIVIPPAMSDMLHRYARGA